LAARFFLTNSPGANLNAPGVARRVEGRTPVINLLFVIAMMMTFGVFAGEGEKLLDRFLSDTNTMSASFRQTLMSDNGFVMQESSGKFYLQRPGKFRWDYTQPYEQQIVSDGEKIFIYDVDLEQVTVQQQNNALSNTPMALMQGKVQLAESFDVEEMDNKDGVYRLKLNSKKADGDFNGIVVGVDKNGLRFLQLKDQFDQTTDIVFEDLQSNNRLQSSLFEFEPPPGVDVFGGS
jgi:outer membrane lipoprotein carrier protein